MYVYIYIYVYTYTYIYIYILILTILLSLLMIASVALEDPVAEGEAARQQPDNIIVLQLQ